MRSPVYELRSPRSTSEWDRYHHIRKSCLFDVYHPWIPYDPDYPDEFDPANHPLVFLRNGRVIGTIRIDMKPDGRAIFRMVAIEPRFRGHGTGSRLLEMAESYAFESGADSVCLNSVGPAVGFYARHGFTPHRWEGCTSCPSSVPVMKRFADGLRRLAGRLAPRPMAAPLLAAG